MNSKEAVDAFAQTGNLTIGGSLSAVSRRRSKGLMIVEADDVHPLVYDFYPSSQLPSFPLWSLLLTCS